MKNTGRAEEGEGQQEHGETLGKGKAWGGHGKGKGRAEEGAVQDKSMGMAREG